MSHTYNDMQECTVEEYRRVWDLYKDKLSVFTSYSVSTQEVNEIITSWGIKGMDSQLISSEYVSKSLTDDPEAWTYYVNKDLVDTLATVAGLKVALERLARLGNEPEYGNSEGNLIARAALAKEDDND